MRNTSKTKHGKPAITTIEMFKAQISRAENITTLSREDSEILFQALLDPPKPNKALRGAMQMHKMLIKREEQ